MNDAALSTLLRVRRNHLDEAQRVVGDMLGVQRQAQARREAAQSLYAAETLAALDLTQDDEAVNAFARWLPVGRGAIEAAAQAEQEAAAEVDRARVVMGLTRAAHRAVELLVQTRGEERRRLQEQNSQRELDEFRGRPGSA